MYGFAARGLIAASSRRSFFCSSSRCSGRLRSPSLMAVVVIWSDRPRIFPAAQRSAGARSARAAWRSVESARQRRMRGAEVLVLAFLAGALLRGWTLHRFRNVELDPSSDCGAAVWLDCFTIVRAPTVAPERRASRLSRVCRPGLRHLVPRLRLDLSARCS